MKQIIWIVLLVPFLISGQPCAALPNDSTGNGIEFSRESSWQQVLKKAREEKKYIFVDCYTTWCGPCKQMEKNVYPLEKIGAFFNANFICIKVQMDTTGYDDDNIKAWYADAQLIQKNYKISGYPSFLFLTEEGKIISREIGLQDTDKFLDLATRAVHDGKIYLKQLYEFQKGKKEPDEMFFIANQALSMGDTVSAQKAADAYIASLNESALKSKANIEFLAKFQLTTTSSKVGFNWFYLHSDELNNVMDDDTYSQEVVQRIIYRELVAPELDKVKKTSGTDPDWSALESTIRKRYNSYYAGRVITISRMSWGLNHNNMREYTKYLVKYQDEYGSKSNNNLMESLTLNNYAWAVFENSNNHEELERALSWSGRAVLMYPANPNWMDTYANISYKLGRKDLAIMWEETALKLWPDNESIRETLKKMKE